MTSPSSPTRSDHRNAIDFDVERPRPFRHADEDARGRIFGEVTRVDRVDDREVLGRGAVDVALHHVLQVCARDLQTRACQTTSVMKVRALYDKGNVARLQTFPRAPSIILDRELLRHRLAEPGILNVSP